MPGSIESEELLETMKYQPSWPIRLGIGIVSSILLSLFMVAAFVKFPDDERVEMRLNSNSPISRIISTRSAYVDSVLVKDQGIVGEREKLLLYSTALSWNKLFQLKEEILKFLESDTIAGIELQGYNFQHYPKLADHLIELESSISQLRLIERKMVIHKDAVYRNKIQRELIHRIKLTEDKLSLVIGKSFIEQQHFKNDSMLFRDSVISKTQYLKSLSKKMSYSEEIISMKRELSQLRLNSIEHDQKVHQTEIELKAAYLNQKLEIRNILKRSLVAIEEFEVNHSLVAEQSGIVRQDIHLKKGMFIAKNTQLFSIESKTSWLFGSAEIKSLNSGKMEVGQKVLISLDAYPYSKYGFIEGKLQAINPIIKEGKYKVYFSIPNELITDRNFKVPYLPEMTGTARIICKEQTLLQRISMNSLHTNLF